MQTSETITDLAAALAGVQKSIKSAIKNAENPHLKSQYANLAAVWAVWQECGPAAGFALTQVTGIEAGAVVLHTQLTHSSGQWIRGAYPVNAEKGGPQQMGAALTYARRYTLAAMVGITPDDDDDGETASGRGKRKVVEKDPGATPSTKEQQVQSAAAEWVATAKLIIAKLPSGEAMREWTKDSKNIARMEKLRRNEPELYNNFAAWLDHAIGEARSVGEAA